jgi:hypothetical protein
LLDQKCISAVTELIPSTIDSDAKKRFVIAFEADTTHFDTIVMERSASLPQFGFLRERLPNQIGVRNRVSARNIRKEKGTLLPGSGVCQTSCPPISCSVSNFRDANFVFGVEPDWSGRLPVSGFS